MNENLASVKESDPIMTMKMLSDINAQQSNLLTRAGTEIQHLRLHVGTLQTRLQMFDDLMLIFRSRPDHSQNSGVASQEDVVYAIDKLINKK